MQLAQIVLDDDTECTKVERNLFIALLPTSRNHSGLQITLLYMYNTVLSVISFQFDKKRLLAKIASNLSNAIGWGRRLSIMCEARGAGLNVS